MPVASLVRARVGSALPLKREISPFDGRASNQSITTIMLSKQRNADVNGTFYRIHVLQAMPPKTNSIFENDAVVIALIACVFVGVTVASIIVIYIIDPGLTIFGPHYDDCAELAAHTDAFTRSACVRYLEKNPGATGYEMIEYHTAKSAQEFDERFSKPLSPDGGLVVQPIDGE